MVAQWYRQRCGSIPPVTPVYLQRHKLQPKFLKTFKLKGYIYPGQGSIPAFVLSRYRYPDQRQCSLCVHTVYTSARRKKDFKFSKEAKHR